ALYEIDSGPNVMRVRGFVADPKCDRGNPKLQYLFVNGRWFRDRSIGHALQEAYRGLLMTGRYAVGVLFLDVPAAAVDVNVHPQKHEVRFREQSSVYALVRSAVKTRLLKENLVPLLKVPEQEAREFGPLPPPQWVLSPPAAAPPTLFSPRRELAERTVPPWEQKDKETRDPRPETVAAAEAGRPTPEGGLPATGHGLGAEDKDRGSEAERHDSEAVSPLGSHVSGLVSSLPALAPGSALQVHDSYIVLETPDGMLVIDQHALHERILYEQLRRRIKDGKLEVQRLLIPEPIDLPAEHAALVLEVSEDLARLGLEVSDFGGNTVLLGSYPTLLSRRPPAVILKGVIDHLLTKDRPPSKEMLLDHLLATMACKAAVKAGDRLTQDEIAHLLMLRQMADDSHHCPHGRPTSLLFSRAQLDKQFGRI
ncbi:MAG: DNA mismatch repair endonuclease MutL, partial [Gemmataceae bacterium]